MYGRIDGGQDWAGHYSPTWVVWQVIVGVPRGGLEAFAEEEEFQREVLRVKQRKEQLAGCMVEELSRRGGNLRDLFPHHRGA